MNNTETAQPDHSNHSIITCGSPWIEDYNYQKILSILGKHAVSFHPNIIANNITVFHTDRSGGTRHISGCDELVSVACYELSLNSNYVSPFPGEGLESNVLRLIKHILSQFPGENISALIFLHTQFGAENFFDIIRRFIDYKISFEVVWLER